MRCRTGAALHDALVGPARRWWWARRRQGLEGFCAVFLKKSAPGWSVSRTRGTWRKRGLAMPGPPIDSSIHPLSFPSRPRPSHTMAYPSAPRRFPCALRPSVVPSRGLLLLWPARGWQQPVGAGAFAFRQHHGRHSTHTQLPDSGGHAGDALNRFGARFGFAAVLHPGTGPGPAQPGCRAATPRRPPGRAAAGHGAGGVGAAARRLCAAPARVPMPGRRRCPARGVAGRGAWPRAGPVTARPKALAPTPAA